MLRAVVFSVVVLFVAVCVVDARPKSHKKRHRGEENFEGEVTPCTFTVCPKGSECTFNSSLGDAICVCTRECKPHQRPVCGSDGVIYQNHCELHRAACVKQMHIAAVPNAHCPKPTPEQLGGEPELTGDYPEKVGDDQEKVEADSEVIEEKPKADDDKPEAIKDEVIPHEDKPEVDGDQPEVAEDKPEKVKSEPEVEDEEPVEDIDHPVVEDIPTKVPCSMDGLASFKTSVLDHYRTQFNNPSEKPALPDLDKKFLVSLMTNHFDSSRDSLLTRDEILAAISRDNIDVLSPQCSLLDILHIYDKNGDKKLDPYEMYDAFDVEIITIAEDIRHQTRVATAGENIVLVCGIDVEDKSNIIWQRNGIDLVDVQLLDGMKTYDDGTLYFVQLSLMHMGTYTCYVDGYKSVKQTYKLEVRVPPTVHTCPSSRFQSLGKTARVQCYAQGVPEPERCWSKNGQMLNERPGLRLDDGNNTLRIQKLDYPDTGKYICKATNPSGSVQSVSSVFIQENTKALDHGPMHVFYLFHSDGIRVIDPDTCGFRLSIPAKHVLPKPNGLLCPPGPSGKIACSWGDAVNVLNQYIYVTQPNNNRIIVIDIRTQLIIEYTIHENKANIALPNLDVEAKGVIQTDRVPVSLHYIPHLDTLWVVCWRSTDAEEGQRSIQVIRYVSQQNPHAPIHTTPIGHHFDVIKGLFVPQVQIPKQGAYKFGYVVHSEQMALTKINLETTSLSSTIVLSQHQCYPDSVAFLATGGYVIVSCAEGGDLQPSKQLILDYLTDTVLHVNEGVRGTPYTSPDGRYVISADNQHGLIYVQKVSSTGKVKTLFEVSTNLGVSDVGFFPTKAATHTYDILVTSRDRADVLFVDLETSKVKMVPGVFRPISAESWPWNEHNRHIVNSGVFGPHVATPGADHVVLIDGKKKAVLCDIDDVIDSNVIVWVGDCY